MKNRFAITVGVVASLCLGSGLAAHAQAPAPAPTAPPAHDTVKKEAPVKRVSGTFEVKMAPLTTGEDFPGRMSIDKQFHGALEANSKGEMLAAMTTEGSAGYVAIERVTGKLDGRSGTFVLQHSGIMNRGEPQLTITVVPDSGTGELTGLAGKMAIIIADGKHSYDFEYTLAATQ
jgi:hypothetical protein